jgi:hypothetical protein
MMETADGEMSLEGRCRPGLAVPACFQAGIVGRGPDRLEVNSP